jgi:hypothetical protein
MERSIPTELLIGVEHKWIDSHIYDGYFLFLEILGGAI